MVERLGHLSGYEDYSLFMINSGAEANENALKLASFHTGRSRVLSLKKAFHGRTSLAVEVTDNPKIIAPINACGHVTYLPWGDLEAAKAELAKGDVAAFIIEGIQGVGGIQVPTDEYMHGIREACTKNGTVLILDEIQSGYGRSGKFFAHQYNGIKPDLITVAKGIANGLPCGALLISPMFQPVIGQLGTTFGGNHLACAAALAVMDVIEQEHLVENAANVGSYLLEQLKNIPGPKEVRGRGLMIGMEFDEPIKEIRQRLLMEEHIFTGVSGTNVICLTPVAPHSLTMRPLVLPAGETIRLDVSSRSHSFLVSIDGKSFSCPEHTPIEISLAPFKISVMKPSKVDFFATLREKMLWGTDSRK